ncbi:MAG: DsbA family protein [Gammaproteobacteria bacterium]|nr:DsbA family protein [Gammaproteobacteria bacterium]
MKTATLHYICDPLCGWCYGAAPLVTAILDVENLALQWHCGGLFSGSNVRVIGREMYDFIMSADAHLQALTGQPLGRAYQQELLPSGDVLLDSSVPIKAMLIAEQLAGQGLAMLLAIQHAHYLDGRRVCDAATLQSLATDLGLPREPFLEAWRATAAAAVEEHIAATRRLMAQYGTHSFPTFVLATPAATRVLDHQSYYGKPQAWRELVLQLIR